MKETANPNIAMSPTMKSSPEYIVAFYSSRVSSSSLQSLFGGPLYRNMIEWKSILMNRNWRNKVIYLLTLEKRKNLGSKQTPAQPKLVSKA